MTTTENFKKILEEQRQKEEQERKREIGEYRWRIIIETWIRNDWMYIYIWDNKYCMSDMADLTEDEFNEVYQKAIEIRDKQKLREDRLQILNNLKSQYQIEWSTPVFQKSEIDKDLGDIDYEDFCEIYENFKQKLEKKIQEQEQRKEEDML